MLDGATASSVVFVVFWKVVSSIVTKEIPPATTELNLGIVYTSVGILAADKLKLSRAVWSPRGLYPILDTSLFIFS